MKTSNNDATPHTGNLLLTSAEVGAILHLNPRTLANLRSQGRGPVYVRSGSRALYRWGDIEKWIDGHAFPHVAAERAARASR